MNGDKGYSAEDVTSMLGLSLGQLRAYVRAGVLVPERGTRGEMRFSFQDLALLRTAEGLVTERTPPRRVKTALRKLRERLPGAQPLTGVHLSADGDRIVVQEAGSRWQADSGQGLLAFDTISGAGPAGGKLAALDRPAAPRAAARPQPTADGGGASTQPGAPQPTAEDYYEVACDLEDAAPADACSAYVRALALDADHVGAHVNLGRLLHHAGEMAAAEAHYRMALAAQADDPTAAFNLGVVLEDQGRAVEAMEAYERALALDARNADAHYNVARLCEKAGERAAALRHLRAYRELTRRSTP